MLGLILYWITAGLMKKNSLVTEAGIEASEIKKTHKKLQNSFKVFNVKIMIKNNFDIKPVVLKLFFCSLWIDFLLLGVITLANCLYTSIFFWNSFGIQVSDLTFGNLYWEIGVPIFNILFIFLVIRLVNDSYKLSLRGKYRNQYLKLLYLDIMTLNVFSIIGILIFIRNRTKMIQRDDDYKVNNSNLNSQTLKEYFKLIFKIEMIIGLVILMIFLISLIVGYFVPVNSIKIICFICTFWSMILLYFCPVLRITALVIMQRMIKNLLNSKSYYYLLTIIRFLAFAFGCYYVSVLINFLKFDQNSKEFLMENW